MHCLETTRLASLITLVGVIAMAPNSSRAKDAPASLSLSLAATQVGLLQDSEPEETPADESVASRHPGWVNDVESKMWPGFLTGLAGYEDFVMPVGNFTYFEDPFITTDIRLMYVYHEIPDDSVLRGGQVHAVAVQIRVALTERLALIATKDGYSWVVSRRRG